MPEISIIVPVYNARKYIKICLDSLIGQTFRNIEIICINDGSTDNSYNILEDYKSKDDRIKVLTQKNQGCAVSRNIGLEVSQSKYIMFCDSDDFYEPTMCEKMFNAIESANVNYAMCGTNVIYKNRKNLKSWDDDYFKIDNTEVISVDSKYCVSMKNHVLWNRIWKKSIIDEYGIKFPPQALFDDTIFCKEYLFVSDDIYLLKEKLYNYVRLPNSFISDVSGKIKKDVLCVIKSLVFFYDFLDRNNLYEQKTVEFWSFFIYLYGSYNSVKLSRQAKKELSVFSSLFIKKFNLEDLKNNLSATEFEIIKQILNKKYLKQNLLFYKIKISVLYASRLFNDMI